MDFKALYKSCIITTAKGGLTTVPIEPGSPVWMVQFYALRLPALFYFHHVGITQFACCELTQHVLLRVYDEKMRKWENVKKTSASLTVCDDLIKHQRIICQMPHLVPPPLHCIVHRLGDPWVEFGWVGLGRYFLVFWWVESSIAKVLKIERIILMHSSAVRYDLVAPNS